MKNHESFSQILSSYESYDASSASQSQRSESLTDDRPSVNVQISNHAQLLSFISTDTNTSSILSAKDACIKLNGLLSVLH